MERPGPWAPDTASLVKAVFPVGAEERPDASCAPPPTFEGDRHGSSLLRITSAFRSRVSYYLPVALAERVARAHGFSFASQVLCLCVFTRPPPALHRDSAGLALIGRQ